MKYCDIVEEATHQEAHVKQKWKWTGISIAQLLFLAAFIVLIIVAVVERTSMLRFFGFYEPDGFYHFSVIRAAISNSYRIPKYLSISGWPLSGAVTEPNGFYWVTMLPYLLIGWTGISYYNVMRLVPVLFGIFDMIGAYYLARFFNKDKFFLFLVLALVALSAGDAARTSALIYRGDGFVTIFLLISLIFVAKIFTAEKNRNRFIVFALLSGIFLSLCNYVWNGAPFAVLVYIISLLLIMVTAFVLDKKDVLGRVGYLVLALIVWHILVNFYLSSGFISGQLLVGLRFTPVYVAIAAMWLLLNYGIEPLKSKFLSSVPARLALIAIVVLLITGVVDLFFHPLLVEVFYDNGFVNTSNFTATIQELTSPTPAFLYASFGATLFSTPMSIVILLSSFNSLSSSTVAQATAELVRNSLAWIVMCLGFIPYFFMRVYDSGMNGGWFDGTPAVRLEYKPVLLIFVSYFAVTAYLQLFAVRFNSLISVPLAIFAAYTLYWIVIGAGPIILGIFSKRPDYTFVVLAGTFLVLMLLVYIFYVDMQYDALLTQADGINPTFISALQWFKANSSPNSVALAIWPDGSVIEGIANRTSVTDSVGSQNVQKADSFARWLLNTSNDPQFLTGNLSGMPDYIIARYFWIDEGTGIFQESGLNASTEANYTLAILNEISEANQVNGTLELKLFNPAGTTTYTAIHNGSVESYAVLSNGAVSPFSYVGFYDESNGNFSYVHTSGYNITNGDTLLIQYSEVPNHSVPVNITSAYIMPDRFANSNMMKLLFFCGAAACTWDNGAATLSLVYINQDTKIFRINYNATLMGQYNAYRAEHAAAVASGK